MLAIFSKNVGCMESNEAEVLAILEGLQIFASFSFPKLLVESDSMNVVSWVSSITLPPWGFKFYFNEIKMLSSSISVEFCYVGWSANSFADSWLNLRWTDLSRLFLVICSVWLFCCSFLFVVGINV